MEPLQRDDSWRWFHSVLTTYGTWLDGDRRGFRTRHHREHVEGDYKNPPLPGPYNAREARSRAALKHPPVILTLEQRRTVGEALIERLTALGGGVAAVAVAATHAHLLLCMPPALTRRWLGHAKRHAWFVLRDAGHEGKLWAKRGKSAPIADDAHRANAHRYILRHGTAEGAWTWEHAIEEPDGS